MKKVGNHKSFSRIFFGLAFVLVTSLSAFAQDAAKGKELFNANCAACHKLDGKATGPALRDVASKFETVTLKLSDVLPTEATLMLIVWDLLSENIPFYKSLISWRTKNDDKSNNSKAK